MVLAADAAAQALGSTRAWRRPGPRAVPDLIVHDADPAGDADALDRLALWALKRYAPIVAADPPAGLVIDATGAAHLFGGEEALLADMVAPGGGAASAARAAMAGTVGRRPRPGAFRRPASDHRPVGPQRRGRSPTADRGAAPDPDAWPTSCARSASTRIGELEATPRAPLALRFGPELGRRLDQAFGRAAEPIQPIGPRADSGPARVRRTDRRAGDPGPIHRQAGRSPLRGP